MLDKYECFVKQSRMWDCSIFTAFNRRTAQNVIIKKVRNSLSWNEVLCHRQLQIISRLKAFPKLNQIFRHKGSFFFVFEKTYGSSVGINYPIDRHDFPSVIQLMTQLLQSLRQMEQEVPQIMILPQWVYFHRNSLKIVHYEPFLAKENEERKHIFTHNHDQEMNNSISYEQEQADFMPDQYKGSLVFQLGLIIYRLLTGKKQEKVETRQQYEKYIQHVRQHSQRQILKYSGNDRFTNFIVKMFSSNKFEVPSFQQVYNFFQNNSRQRFKNGNKDLRVQVQLQKIHLTKGRSPVEVKRRARNCCMKPPPAPLKNKQLRTMGIHSENKLKMAKESKLMLPYISIKNSYSIERKRNLTCVNRHNMPISSPHKRQSNREHAKSYGYFQTQPSS